MPTNYVLVDFENVQPVSLDALAQGAFKVKVFVGASQAKGRISFELSHSMQMLGDNAEYVKIARSGPNAMDMHIAYYIGRLLQQDPQAVVHIVSRDTDFDPLVEFLNTAGHACKRVKSIGDIAKPPPPRAPTRAAAPPARVPASGPKAAKPTPAAPKKPPADKLAPIIKHLQALNGKPATRKALAQTIANYLKHHGGAPAEKALEGYIDELIRRMLVSQAGSKVSYQLT